MLQIILIKYFKKKLINQHRILFHLTKPIVITNKKTHKKTNKKMNKIHKQKPQQNQLMIINNKKTQIKKPLQSPLLIV